MTYMLPAEEFYLTGLLSNESISLNIVAESPYANFMRSQVTFSPFISPTL